MFGHWSEIASNNPSHNEIWETFLYDWFLEW